MAPLLLALQSLTPMALCRRDVLVELPRPRARVAGVRAVGMLRPALVDVGAWVVVVGRGFALVDARDRVPLIGQAQRAACLHRLDAGG